MPLILSFEKTSFKAGNQLLSLAKFAGVNSFARKYKLVSKKSKNDSFQWFSFDVLQDGKPTDEEYQKAKSWFNEYRTKTFTAHEEVVDEETSDRPF